MKNNVTVVASPVCLFTTSWRKKKNRYWIKRQKRKKKNYNYNNYNYKKFIVVWFVDELFVRVALRIVSGVSGTHPAELDNLYLMLDQQYHPIPPDETCPQSVQIFEEHKQVLIMTCRFFFFFCSFLISTLLDHISPHLNSICFVFFFSF